MKKIEKLNITSEKLLQNEELITLRGGVENNNCPGDATCGIKIDWYNPEYVDYIKCCIPKAEVDRLIELFCDEGTIHWCCDSCGSSTYCSGGSN